MGASAAPGCSDEDYFVKGAAGQEAVSTQTLQTLLVGSPAARQTQLTERLIAQFLESWLAQNMPPPSTAKAPAKVTPSPKTLLRSRSSSSKSSASRSASPSPTRERAAAPKFKCAQFLTACKDMQDFATKTFEGTVIIGNGRSVLDQGAGPVIDKFSRVVRFNDYQIEGYEADIGSKTDLWVVSDWTCLKLLNKYPDRTLPVLIAVPFKFMGKPYYLERRAEVEAELTAEQKTRCTFVPLETVKAMVEENHFGERWPSSGLICIVHLLSSLSKVSLHGFDFFKEIGELPHIPPPQPCLPPKRLPPPSLSSSLPSARLPLALHPSPCPSSRPCMHAQAHMHACASTYACLCKHVHMSHVPKLEANHPARERESPVRERRAACKSCV